jgi:hypothetical protein
MDQSLVDLRQQFNFCWQSAEKLRLSAHLRGGPVASSRWQQSGKQLNI